MARCKSAIEVLEWMGFGILAGQQCRPNYGGWEGSWGQRQRMGGWPRHTGGCSAHPSPKHQQPTEGKKKICSSSTLHIYPALFLRIFLWGWAMLVVEVTERRSSSASASLAEPNQARHRGLTAASPYLVWSSARWASTLWCCGNQAPLLLRQGKPLRIPPHLSRRWIRSLQQS